MDHKTWLWKKKSTDKTITTSDKVKFSPGGNEEQTLPNDKAELDRDLAILNEKLSLALIERNAKDDFAKQQGKVAKEAIAGWENAETEAISLKQELEKAIKQKLAGEERLTCMDAALKECMQQLCFVREEQEKRIHDAMVKTSREFEKMIFVLEERLAATSKRLAIAGSQNTQLSKALLAKEKVINDLEEHRARAEANFSTLMNGLESTEKENATLKYEIRVVEKELEIRNEEREFNRRTAHVAHKQHLESVKKIAKLESECQRLRLLVRKRLPGPAALAKMKVEVEMLARGPTEIRRRNSTSSLTGSIDFAVNAPDTPTKRINFLAEQLYALEEENSSLKEALIAKTNDLQLSKNVGIAGNLSTTHEFSMASTSDMGSDEKFNCAESWASSLISEGEPLRNRKNGRPLFKSVGASDINLMDDFVEMEKLAIVSTDSPSIQSEKLLIDKIPVWVNDVAKVILERTHVMRRNPEEILEDIKVALAHISPPNPNESVATLKPLDKSSIIDSADRLIVDKTSLTEKSNQQLCSDLSKSIRKMIELVDGINLPSPGKTDNSFPCKISETPIGYMVRVFQWKISDLSVILQNFVQICYDMLNGKADIENFAEELASALEWIMNHCFSLQDVSSMRDAIKKQFDWDESRSECEIEGGMVNHFPEAHNLQVPIVGWKCHNSFLYTEQLQSNVREESIRLQDEMPNTEYQKESNDSNFSNNERLTIQLRESEKTIESLKVEVESLSQSKRCIEDQFENLKTVKEDLDKHLTAAKIELSKACEKLSFLEEDLDNKNICCEELEASCLDLQLQLESMKKKEFQKSDSGKEVKQLQNDLEIAAASEKLAECQETILNLGRQLQAMASPRDASLFDKVIATPSVDAITRKDNNQRTSLLDKMLAEDNAKTKEIICTSKSPAVVDGTSCSSFGLNCTKDSQETYLNSDGIKNQDGDAKVNSLAIVPGKKKGSGGLWKKLLWRRKKGNCKKPPFPYAA